MAESRPTKLKGTARFLQHVLCLGAFCTAVVPSACSQQAVAAEPNLAGWYYNPFGKEIAIHRFLGTGPVYAEDDEPCTLLWLQHEDRGFKINTYPYGAAFVDVDESCPEVSLTWATNFQIKQPDSSLPVMVRIPREQFPPQKPKKGAFDGNVSIYDRTTHLIHDCYGYQYNGGKPTAAIHKQHDIRGLGHGSKLNQRVGNSAAGFPHVWGAIRAWEIETPGQVIAHAHSIAVPRIPGHLGPPLLGKAIQWPASSSDSTAGRPEHNPGPFPYGALLAIPPEERGGPNLEELGLSEPGLRMARSMRDYGLYIADGGGGINFRTDGYSPLFVQLGKDLKTLLPFLRLVTNSVVRATARHEPTGRIGDIGIPTWPAGSCRTRQPRSRSHWAGPCSAAPVACRTRAFHAACQRTGRGSGSPSPR